MGKKYPFEEYTRVAWVPSVANLSSPNAVEIEAGIDLSCHLTKDGLNPGGSTNGIDSGALCSRIGSQIAGSVSYSATLRFFRYDDDDDVWDLVNWGDTGFLVVRRGISVSTAWGVSQGVEVYSGQFGEPIVAPSATNTMTTFEVGLFVENADLKAVIGASS